MPARKSMLHPAPPRPELESLLEKARQAGGATEEEINEQRISFAYGNAPASASEITKDAVREFSSRHRLRV